jgi:hypothetical protein
MKGEQTNDPRAAAESMALQALGWALSDDARTDRVLALTGLTPERLRACLTQPALLAAALRFLEAYEPDLLACAEFLEVSPLQLVETRRRLEA